MFNLDNNFITLIICYLILLKPFAVFSEYSKAFPSNITRAPYLVYILNEADFECAGTLVSNQFVATAAHCVAEVDPSSLTVVADASFRSDPGIRSTVAEIIIHKAYDPKTMYMDAAVLKLSNPLNGSFAKPIELCKQRWHLSDPVKLFGWSVPLWGCSSVSNQMYEANAKLLGRFKCEQMYKPRKVFTNSMFCATAPEYDICVGNQGGPVIINEQFCGIVSGGDGCLRENYPNIFINVLKIRSFIQNAIKM